MTQAVDRSHGWRIGRLRGVPIYLGWSWALIAVVIVAIFGPQLQREGFSATSATFIAAAYAVLLLVSVLVHEAGHTIAAQASGQRVDRIVATLMGGHTVFAGGQLRPRSAALIAAAGPLGNLALAAVGWGAQRLIEPAARSMPELWVLAGAFVVANLFVAIFNLLPGLPLDGGHILAAGVWGATGRRSTGLLAAGWVGRVLAVVVVAWMVVRPLLAGERPDLFSIGWVALIGAFLWQGATQSIGSARAQAAVARVPLASVLRPVVVVPGHVSAETLVRGLMEQRGAEWAVALDPVGRPMGFLDLQAVASVPAEQRPQVPVTSFLLAPSPGWVVVGLPDGDITPIVQALAGHLEGEQVKHAVLVVDPAGRAVGTVSLDDVEHALQDG